MIGESFPGADSGQHQELQSGKGGERGSQQNQCVALRVSRVVDGVTRMIAKQVG